MYFGDRWEMHLHAHFLCIHHLYSYLQPESISYPAFSEGLSTTDKELINLFLVIDFFGLEEVQPVRR